MTTDRQALADERAESLPLALIVLAVGSLLVAPLLARVSSGFAITCKVERTAHAQYTADAGIEYALWSLSNNPDLRDAALDALGTAQELTLPASVNGGDATVRLVAVEAMKVEQDGPGAILPYAVLGNNTSRTNTVVVSGSGHRIVGAVHSNNQLRITGSGHSVEGQVTYVGDISVVGSGNYFVPPPPDNPSRSQEPLPFPITWNLEQFDDPEAEATIAQQAAAAGLYTRHTDDWHISGAGAVVPPGLHYCLGNVIISGAGVTGEGVTIVALGTINVSGSGMSFKPYVPGLTFYSSKEATTNVISISGSGNTGGTSYAPGGTISLTGSGGTIVGAFLGDRVDIAGSGATIQLAEVPLPGAGSQNCGVYDIESVADSTRTLVRVTDCAPEGPRILSWYVD